MEKNCSSEVLLRYFPEVRAITASWEKLSEAQRLYLVQLLTARNSMTGLRMGRKKER
jgi:hypothetical protein